MDHNETDPTERCPNGRCWTGPVLVFETRGGAVPDLRQWVKIMLSRNYNKETTLGIMSCLQFTHIYEEHAIMCFATGREPHTSAMREVYARVRLDYGGILKSNCSSYAISILGEGEQEKGDALVAHYDWLARAAVRDRIMKGASV